MRNIYLFFGLLLSCGLYAQTETLPQPQSFGGGSAPIWTGADIRESDDSCGAYFNNYVGLAKTTDLYFEGLRRGSIADFNPYAGRAQRFSANQEIEISGLQFYAFETNPIEDSLMVVTLLYDYDEILDSVGVELARDTVWVSHEAFTPDLPEIAVNSYFDEPVIVTEDYIVAVYTHTDDSLKIITNDPGGDGDEEGVSFAYYDNPAAPSYTGWYNTLATFGPAYDIDYLISPRVKYKMHNGFVLEEDTICPTIVSAACVEYEQVANFSDAHYNQYAGDPTGKIRWYWDDGLQNEDLTSLCHTYAESGTYTIMLTDSIRRYNVGAAFCAIAVMQEIVVADSAIANGNFTQTASTVLFENTSTLADSVMWDFGDGNTSMEENPTHIYDGLDTYSVWLYAYGRCNTDSTEFVVTTDDVSINEEHLNFKMAPNPANQEITLFDLPVDAEISIVSIVGKEVFTQKIIDTSMAINTSEFAEGTYIVLIKSNESTATEKLIIQH